MSVYEKLKKSIDKNSGLNRNRDGCCIAGVFLLGLVAHLVYGEVRELISSISGDIKPISVYTHDVNSDGILDLIIENSDGRRFSVEGQEDGRYIRLEERF